MELNTRLKELKLAWIRKTYEIRNKEAIERRLSYIEFLELLLEDELRNREDNSFKRRRTKSNLPYDKTLDDYDFNFQPTLNKKLIFDLATCNFIEKKENIILIWQPWTWKTHIAVSIANNALLRGYSVVFTSASEMIDNLHKSFADNTQDNKLKYYIKSDLLILDEFGFKPLSQNMIHYFFEIISRRYEKKSMIITSNKVLEEWDSILFDRTLITAILDRLMHHCNLLHIKWESYRIKDYLENKWKS